MIEQIRKNLKKKIRSGRNIKMYNETDVDKTIILDKKLKNIYKTETEKRINNEIEKQKQYEPITSGLKSIEEAVRKTDDDITSFLVPVKPFTQTSNFLDAQQKLIEDTPTRSSIYLGELASKYLPITTDNKFGIWFNTELEKYMIGKKEVNFNNNDIILDNKRYKGTQGLWRLLSYSQFIDPKFYTPEDFNTYKKIILETDSIYQNNDKNCRRVKSSKGEKYIKIIAPIWKEITENKVHEGSGLINYTENPIQYKYINNLNELLKRLYFIAAEEAAGNNNFHNEKLAVINFVNKEMDKLIDTSKGIEYLITFVSSLPKKVIKGSGLVNNFLNMPVDEKPKAVDNKMEIKRNLGMGLI